MTGVHTRVQAGPGRWARAAAWADSRPWAFFAGLGVVSAVIYLVNVNSSPDYVVDEIFYARASQNTLHADAIAIGTQPLLVHPQLLFLANAGWLWITNSGDASFLDAVHSLRIFNALLCALAAVLAGLLVRELLRHVNPTRRVVGSLVAGLFVALNAFLLAFGRTALMEPAAIAVGAGVVLLALRLRKRPAAVQILVLGVAIGLGCLVKQTVVFAALSPLLAALLQRDGRRARTMLGAVGVGLVVWASSPIWATVNGYGGVFWEQQTTSLERLIGAVTTTGVNLPNGAPTTQFGKTFPLYASGYLMLLAAGLAMLAILVRSLRAGRAGWRLREPEALAVALGLLSFGFVAYSFLFGAGNQPLTTYGVVASAVLIAVFCCDPQAGRPQPAAARTGTDDDTDTDAATERIALPTSTGGRRTVVATTAALAVVGLIAAVGWIGFYVVGRDDGTQRMADYISDSVAECVPVNATGSSIRWQAALPENPVTALTEGPDALSRGVHLFLVSPKDARYSYGSMSEEFSTWIKANGTLLHSEDSRYNEGLELWQVGEIQQPAAGTTGCGGYTSPPSTAASAVAFVLVLVIDVFIVVAVGALLIRRSATTGRTEPPVDAGADRS